MKKAYIIVVPLLVIIIGAVLLYKPRLNATNASLTCKKVIIPLNNKYTEVYIDDDNKFVGTNEKNVWRFTNTDIYLSKTSNKGYDYMDNVKFRGNTVWRELDGQYINITDSEGHMKWPADSLDIATLKTNEIVTTSAILLSSIPEYKTPEHYTINDQGIAYNALDIEENDIITTYDSESYYNAYVTYGTMSYVFEEELARLYNLTGQITAYYEDGKCSYVESGDRYFAIKRVNVNTMLVVNGRGSTYKDYAMVTIFGER